MSIKQRFRLKTVPKSIGILKRDAFGSWRGTGSSFPAYAQKLQNVRNVYGRVALD